MGRSQMQSAITLFGYVDPSFNRLSGKLAAFGGQVGAVGSSLSMIAIPLAAAGKKVLDTYKTYDSSKRYVQSLEDYSDRTMAKFDAVARQYGKSTKYTATQSMDAIGLLTQAGLNYEDTMTTLPNVLQMATAGTLDMADAADKLISNMYATGTPFAQSAAYVDLLAVAANKTNSDIGSLAEGVQRMGATARMFAGGNREVITWLGVMGNLGYQGGEAGTYLRNSLLALAAPTEKAAEVMDALDASEQDLADAMEDAEAVNAAKTMREIGLSMYDAQGKIRPVVDVFGDLERITSKMTDEEKNDIMSKLFPKRTLGAAGGIMNELNYAKELYTALGDVTGAAAKMAATRTGGIEGNLQRVSSALQELMITIGDVASDDLMEFTEQLRQGILDLAETDPETLRNILSVLGTIAVAGPALLIAGKAIGMIVGLLALAATPGGAIALGAVALGALAFAVDNNAKALGKANLDERFGELTIDAEALNERVEMLAQNFDAGMSPIEEYGQKLDEATTQYRRASGSFSAGLLDASIFEYTLTMQDKANLLQLAQNMYTEVQSGITTAKAKSKSFLDLLFEEGDATGVSLDTKYDTYFASVYSAAEHVANTIKEKLTLAMKDGKVTLMEKDEIQAYVDEYNRIMAEINAGIETDAFYKDLAKAQRMGLEGLEESNKVLGEALKTRETSLRAEIDNEVGKAMRAGATTEEIAAIRSAGEQYISEQLAPLRQAIMRMNNEVVGQAFGDLFTSISKDVNGMDIRKVIDEGVTGEGKYNAFKPAAQTALDYLDGNMSALTQAYLDEQAKYRDTMMAVTSQAMMGTAMVKGDVEGLKTVFATMNNAYPIDRLAKEVDALMMAGEKVPDAMAGMYRTYANIASVLFTGGVGDPFKQLLNGKADLWWELLDPTKSVFGLNTKPTQETLYGNTMQRNADPTLYAHVPGQEMFGGRSEQDSLRNAEAKRNALRAEIDAVNGTYGGLMDTMKNAGEDVLRAADAQIGLGDLNGATVDALLTMISATEYAKRVTDGAQLGNVRADFDRMKALYDPAALTRVIENIMDQGGDVPQLMVDAYRTYADMARMLVGTGHWSDMQALMGKNGDLLWNLINGTYQPTQPQPASHEDNPDGSFWIGDKEYAQWDSVLEAQADKNGMADSAESAGTTARKELLDAWGSPMLTAYIQTVDLGTGYTGRKNNKDKATGNQEGFAEGGRATAASIFGEAGAEWAIPEAHTKRTASLLASAAKASGFTFGELASRTGGLNADAARVNAPPVFSPVFNFYGGKADAEQIAEMAFQKFKDYDRERKRDEERERYS